MTEAPTEFVQATESFATEIDGVPTLVRLGELVRTGHPVIACNPSKFKPAEQARRFSEVEQMTAAPGEKRAARRSRSTTPSEA